MIQLNYRMIYFKIFVELSADRNVTLDVEDKNLGDRNQGSR